MKDILLILIIIGIILMSTKGVEARQMMEFLKYYIRKVNPKLTYKQIADISESLVTWCDARGINLFSFTAICQRESSFNPKAVGDTVSRGISQLTKMALDELVRVGYIKGYDWEALFNVDYNISLGTLYYLYCVRLAKGDRREAIARYRKTFDPYSATAQEYATSVLKIRDSILKEYNEYKK